MGKQGRQSVHRSLLLAVDDVCQCHVANAIVLLLLEGIMVRVFHGNFDCVDAHLRVQGEEEFLTVRLADLKSGLNRRFSQRIIWMRIEVSIDGDQSLLLYQQGITFLPWKLKTKRRKAS